MIYGFILKQLPKFKIEFMILAQLQIITHSSANVKDFLHKMFHTGLNGSIPMKK